MTTISHKNLSGTQLHENKGVAAASDNTVATASSGATVWAKLTATNLTGTGNSFGAQLFHVRQESSGAAGTLTGGSWVTRILDTIKTNEITSASLALNQITLPSGTYYAEASAPAVDVGYHSIRLYNITDSSLVLIGTSERTGTSGTVISRSFLNGRFTISGTKVFELQHISASTLLSYGLGTNSGLIPTEVYAEIKIWKIA